MKMPPILKGNNSYNIFKTLSFPGQNLQEGFSKADLQRKDPALSGLMSLLHFASINNVEFQLAENILMKQMFASGSDEEALLKRILGCCRDNKKEYFDTLAFISGYLEKNKIKYMMIKSYAPYDFIRDDVDILIIEEKGYFEAVDFLSKNQWKLSSRQDTQMHFDRDGMVQIDLHKLICWDNFGTSGIGLKLFNNSKLWERRRTVKLKELAVPVPSVEDDILIIGAHSIFQHHYTTLNERIHIAELIKEAKEIDIEYIIHDSRLSGWNEGMEIILRAINSEYEVLFKQKLFTGDSEHPGKRYWPEENFILFHPLGWVAASHLRFLTTQRPGWSYLFKALIGINLALYRLIRYKLFYTLPFNACFLKRCNICNF